MPSPSDLDSRYDHGTIEEKIYDRWEKSGYFNPDKLPAARSKIGARRPKTGKRTSITEPRTFTIIMPPPNANGSLHMGHAVFVTLEDILIRYWRMRGRRTLWLPGADHAGFETQVVFDKKLEKEGRRKQDIPREALWQEMFEFTQTNKKVMEGQLRKLGASCDWSRERFTLDQSVVEGVHETFEKLYRDNLIYRGERIVNWCAKHQTSLSELETQSREQADPFYYFQYGPFVIGTVRPETKFGDKYVVMHPDDERYKQYSHGQTLELEWINGPITATIIKDSAVDMGFGTGVMTITPWHTAIDFEIAERHGLDKEQVIDFRGKLLPIAGEFAGLPIAEARGRIVEKLQAKGLLVKTDADYRHTVQVCFKCAQPVEPQIRKQWWMKMEPLAKEAMKAVKTRRVKIRPDSSEKVFFHWLRNIRDWNISRQTIWGIRIPAWFCMGCGKVKVNPPLRATWHLLRHGDVKDIKERSIGQLDLPLTEEGLRQAAQNAATLQSKKIDLIVSSDMIRTRQTAEIIARATGAKIVFEKDLRERHLGISQGMLKEERDRLYGKDVYSYTDKPPGGESFAEVEARTLAVWKRYLKEYGDKNVVIVAHGGPLRLILKNLRNESVETLDRNPRRDEMIAGEPRPGELRSFDLLDLCPDCKGAFHEQDPDVFDAWFSSGQWPYLSLGYPKSADYKKFYPTDVMETGYDILFFWVARMIMFGLYRTGQVPFRDVYLHGMVRDKDRQKMSKSKGNVIDPLGVAAEYGVDAVRAALVAGTTAGNDTAISEDKIRGYRNFTTKLWNIARFVLLAREKAGGAKAALTLADKKNLDGAKKVRAEVAKHIERFEFHLAIEKAYHYTWHTFADKTIETSKSRLESKRPETRAAAGAALEAILLECLTMLHPFMPFVTEELYQRMRSAEDAEFLMIRPW